MFAQITFSIPGADFNVLKEWGDIVSEEYHETLSDWAGFDQNIQLHQWQMIVNGVGPIFWPHAISWHSQATKCRKVLVPQETKANVDELEVCVVLHSLASRRTGKLHRRRPRQQRGLQRLERPLMQKSHHRLRYQGYAPNLWHRKL